MTAGAEDDLADLAASCSSTNCDDDRKTICRCNDAEVVVAADDDGLAVAVEATAASIIAVVDEMSGS